MAFFGLFNKKDKRVAASLEEVNLTVDMHSHLIPGIDDGAKDLRSAVEMVGEMGRLGFRKLITTPHVMGDFYKNSPETIRSGLNKLSEALKEEGIEVQVEAAAEYYLDEWFESKIKNKEILTFGDNYVLVETSYMNRQANLDDLLFQLKVAGYKPVLAHPERYVFLYDDFAGYEALFDQDILLQLNIMSLLGYYSPEARMVSEKLIDRGMVHFAGSDLHSLRHIKPLKEALATPYFRKLCKLDLLNRELV